jgi:ribosomal protein L11 methyltransferase
MKPAIPVLHGVRWTVSNSGENSVSDRPTTLARLTADQATARHILDALPETADPDTMAASASEAADGWLVEIHFRDPPDEGAIRALIGAIAGPDAAKALSFSSVATTDWVAKSLAGLKPVTAGRFIVHGAHDRKKVAVHRIGIEIEAALAFGTGHHGTTRGCLLALDAIAKQKRPRRILDIGTGSGVLAIAAARLLRRKVLASDIDAEAVTAARQNARSNRAASLIEIIVGPGLSAHRFRESAPFDLIFANILLAPLQRLSAPVARLIAPGGHIVLSGLLPSHAAAALSAYGAQGLRLERRITLEGWATLVLRQPA